jgi:hypothetical protein
MSEPYVAQVMIFAFNFAPRNWAYCNGALVAMLRRCRRASTDAKTGPTQPIR